MTLSKIMTIANVPPELEQAWLQHLRNFDTANPGCHFEVVIDAREQDKTVEEMKATLGGITPGFAFMKTWTKP